MNAKKLANSRESFLLYKRGRCTVLFCSSNPINSVVVLLRDAGNDARAHATERPKTDFNLGLFAAVK